MSNELLNNALAFIPYPYQRDVIGLAASLVEAQTGAQQVIQHSAHDRRRYVLSLSGFTRTERDDVIDFYMQREGIIDDFLFNDIVENFAPRGVVATADGVETKFQLKHVRGSVAFNRWDIYSSPAPLVWVDGTLQTEGVDYTIAYQEDGRITFAVAPADTLEIEAEFYFYRRCRFVTPYQDFEINYEWVNNLLTLDEKIVKVTP